jgi:hypothetical protein
MAARYLHGLPADSMPPLETPCQAGVMVALVLDPGYRLRFLRTGPSGPLQAREDVAHLAGQRHWRIRLSWDWDEPRLSVQAESADPAGSQPQR